MLKRNFCWIVIAVFMLSQTAFAEGINLETVYPYSLEHKNIYKTVGSATNPFYINIESYDAPEPQDVKVEILLPEGLTFNEDDDWQEVKTGKGLIIKRSWTLPANYGQNFDLLYLRLMKNLPKENMTLLLKLAARVGKRIIILPLLMNLEKKTQML